RKNEKGKGKLKGNGNEMEKERGKIRETRLDSAYDGWVSKAVSYLVRKISEKTAGEDINVAQVSFPENEILEAIFKFKELSKLFFRIIVVFTLVIFWRFM